MKKRKKKHFRLLIVTGILVAGAGFLFVSKDQILNQVKTKVAAEVGKKVLTQQLKTTVNVDGKQVEVSEIMEHMDQSDVEEVTGIAEKYISPENLKQAADLAASGNVDGLKDLAEGQVSQEDKQRLQELYEKYKDQLP